MSDFAALNIMLSSGIFKTLAGCLAELCCYGAKTSGTLMKSCWLSPCAKLVFKLSPPLTCINHICHE